ncbi:MAG: AAA family ATPase [Lachnospiraceae bacterium]|nr:AAA family ATPase [Lachnospiraceae bacterium]
MKVIILDSNTEYSTRVKYFMEKKHPMLQIFACDNYQAAKETIENEKCEVALFDAAFDSIDAKELAALEDKVAFSFISERNEIVWDREAFCKYVPISELYARIISLYEKKKNRILKENGKNEESESAKIITFLPICGGAGSSTMAATCAIALAKDAKVLYLNLEQDSSDTSFFASECKKTISDVISMLKTKYTDAGIYNLLKEIIAKDTSQRYANPDYVRGYRNIPDCLDFAPNGIEAMLRIIKRQFDYQFIIIDTGFIAGPFLNKIITLSDSVVFVSNGSDVANAKMQRIRRYFEIIGQNSQAKMPKEYVIFNQYYGVKDEAIITRDMTVILRIPRFRTDDKQHISSQTVINQVLREAAAFDVLK